MIVGAELSRSGTNVMWGLCGHSWIGLPWLHYALQPVLKLAMGSYARFWRRGAWGQRQDGHPKVRGERSPQVSSPGHSLRTINSTVTVGSLYGVSDKNEVRQQPETNNATQISTFQIDWLHFGLFTFNLPCTSLLTIKYFGKHTSVMLIRLSFPQYAYIYIWACISVSFSSVFCCSLIPSWNCSCTYFSSFIEI